MIPETITANGNYNQNTVFEKDHRVVVYGTFDGASVSIQTKEGVELINLTAPGGCIGSFGGEVKLAVTSAGGSASIKSTIRPHNQTP